MILLQLLVNSPVAQVSLTGKTPFMPKSSIKINIEARKNVSLLFVMVLFTYFLIIKHLRRIIILFTKVASDFRVAWGKSIYFRYKEG